MTEPARALRRRRSARVSLHSRVATTAGPRHSMAAMAVAVTMVLATVAAGVLVGASAAAAAGPAVVQTAGGAGSNATPGSSVAITATLTKSCTAGDTLVAFVTVGQQVGDAGVVAVAPQGWLRLYEHAPSDHVAEFHAWFVLSACSGVSAATFTVSAPGNPDGTTGSVVLTEYSGLPSSPVLEFGTNTGNGGGATSGSLTSDDTAPSGTFVLTALSLYAPSSVTSTPSGWTSGGSEGGSLPATTWWQVGAGQVPSAAFSWSPASAAWEMSMVIIGAGTASPPNVVQEASGGFSSSSWSVALPDGVTTGDAVVAIILSNATEAGQGFEASTVSGGGVTWQKVTGFGTSGGGTAEIWAGFSSAGTTGSTTVTAKLQGSASGQMVISEVSGIDGVDTTSTASGSSTTPTASSISPTSGDFLVAGMASPGSVVTVHPTPQWSTYSVSTSAAYAGEWWSNVPSHSISAQWDDASSAPWAAVVAAFIAGPGGSSPGTVTPVGTFSANSGSGLTTLADAPQNLGDVMVLFARVTSTSLKLSSVTGGGVSTWSKGAEFAASAGQDIEIWYGPVTATGSSTITFTWSGSVSAKTPEYGIQEFDAGLGPSTLWALDKSGTLNNASSSTVSFPSLTPTGAGELYFGFAFATNDTSSGSNAGFSYVVTPMANIAAYNPDVSAAVAPTATESPAGTSASAGVLLDASTTTTSPPTVTSLSTTTGPTTGGTSTTITGTNFNGVTGVKFGTTAATTFTVNSPTSITVTSPAVTSAGAVDVTVSAAGGTSAANPPGDQFTYTTTTSPPTVTSLSTTTGPTTGGTSTTITGTNFNGVTGVKFGTTAATTFTVNSPTSITVTSPAVTSAGAVDVTVSAAGGTSAANPPGDQFTYTSTAPTITAVGTFSANSGSGLTTLADAPQNLGDVMVLFARVTSTSLKLSSVTGGGVSTWSKGAQFAASAGQDIEIWYGPVTATGSSTITFTWSGSVSAKTPEYGIQEFDAGLGPSTLWALDKSGTLNNASSSTVSFPSLTPTGAGELYFGFAFATNDTSSGSNAGFSYVVTPMANIAAYNPDVSAAVAPTATESPAGTSASAGVLLDASTTTTSPPTVTSLSTTTGPTTGGTSTTITGTNFNGVTGVKFGTTAATTFTVNSPTSITVTSPAVTSAGAVDVTVSAAGGTSAANPPGDQFTYTTTTSPPTVTSLSTTTGPTTGGTSTTITGTNFNGVTGVKFGTTAATTFTVNSPTSITVTSPAVTSAGAVDVTVSAAGGTSAANPPGDQFTYTSTTAPTITPVGTFSAQVGSGLTTLADAPQNLGDVMVLFARVTSTSLKLSSVTGGGVSTWSKGAQFAASAGQDIEIWYGPVTATGSSTITFTWSGSVSAKTPEYGIQEFDAGLGPSTLWALDKSGTLNNASSSTVSFPSLTPTGAGELYFGFAFATNDTSSGSNAGFSYVVTPMANIAAYNPDVSAAVAPTATESPAGTSASAGVLLDASTTTTSPPTVTSLSTTTGPTTGGTSTTITGTNFNGVTGVKFGTTAATTFTVNSPTSITVTSPAVTSAGAVDVTVSAAGGTSAANPPGDQFTYTTTTSPPTVTSLSTTTGPTTGGTSTTITGTNFNGVTGVKFGTTAATTFTVNSPTSITVTSPAVTSAGTVDVTVSAAGGTSAANPPGDQFTYTTTTSPPTVTSLSTTTGPTTGGTSTTITGTNFNGVTGVKFGTTAATTFTVNSPTSITVTSPAVTSAGAVDVTVSAAGGTSAANPPGDQFTYTTTTSPPTVTSLSTTTGPTTGGTSTTITGTNFNGVTGVKFGTTAATTFTVNSPTSITVTSPAVTSAGAVDVTVSAAGGTSAANPPGDQFTYTSTAPTITAVGTFSANSGSGLTTLADAPQNLGDVMVLFARVTSTSLKLSSVTGGGVSTWSKGAQFAASAGQDIEIWYGPVTATGSSTITFTWSGSVSAKTPEYGIQEFDAGLGPSTLWALDKSGTLNNASSSTVSFPSLTPTGAGELYFGFAFATNDTSSGSNAGFSYVVTPMANIAAYNPDVSAAVAPTATESPAGTSASAGVLISAA